MDKETEELKNFLKLVLPFLKSEIRKYPNKIYSASLFEHIEYRLPKIEKILE
jgi:hypothetical protein